jgi:hypothetical protein
MLVELEELYKTLDTAQTFRHKIQGQIEMLTRNREEFSMQLMQIMDNIQTLEKAGMFLQLVSASAREVAKVQIEQIVTNAIQYVFGPQYAFKIEIKQSTSANP